jgi:predicted aspartyl protease
MAVDRRLTSSHYPYIPIHLQLAGSEHLLEALLDTGFDGDVVLPADLVPANRTPDVYLPGRLADDSEFLAPAYSGVIRIDDFDAFMVAVMALGGETLVGRGVADRFRITLDHGQMLTVEP